MQFDLFHSLGRIDSIKPRLADREVFANFFAQSELGESLGYDTMWVAESHFSSEVQKTNKEPVIPNYLGEVGLNCDSMQLFQNLAARTKKLNFGTAIFNIVGGNGGPLAAADRVRTMAFLNDFLPQPRQLNIGVAQGRFPYINAPFGIVPRDAVEKANWADTKRILFLEALEIFLRLSRGETLSSDMVLRETLLETKFTYRPRWDFEALKLVPDLTPQAAKKLNFVLGSHCPLARQLAFSLCDMDVFNLSFTPPEQLNKIHTELAAKCREVGRKPWHRSRMPRTVLVFIDQDAKKAQSRASACFDTYIEAMRGTAEVPNKDFLMARALIGNPQDISAQLNPDDPHGFQSDDRLMLWFEFNQAEGEAVRQQMRLFAEKVIPNVA